jgi:hypothetical protein
MTLSSSNYSIIFYINAPFSTQCWDETAQEWRQTGGFYTVNPACNDVYIENPLTNYYELEYTYNGTHIKGIVYNGTEEAQNTGWLPLANTTGSYTNWTVYSGEAGTDYTGYSYYSLDYLSFTAEAFPTPPTYLISGIIRNIILIFVFVILSIVIFGLMSQITSGDVGIREVIISMAFSLLYAYFLSVWIYAIIGL